MKYKFTFNNEISRGKIDSRYLHHPTKSSGVTIGAGFDMKHIDQKTILKYLKKAGVDSDIANKISYGSLKTGVEASNFCKENKHISISSEQEIELFNILIEDVYINRTISQYNKLNIKNKPDFNMLNETVQTILFDYSYNVSINKFPKFFNALISGNKTEALQNYKRFSCGIPLGRRNTETLQLLNDYNFKDLRE